MLDHDPNYRKAIVAALNAHGGDAHALGMARAMTGHLPDPVASNRSARGFAAVVAGTPDFGQNDARTDCIDALTNLLHYAAYTGSDAQDIIDSALVHFNAEQHGDDLS